MNRLRDLRVAQGWTQAELGKKIGLAKTTISGYESESHYLDPPTIHTLCDLFGCTADYLLGRSELQHPVVTDDDVLLLEAYHDAPDHVRAAIDSLLLPVEPKKKGVV